MEAKRSSSPTWVEEAAAAAAETSSTITLLIRNLHCHSCVSNIQDALSTLTSKPLSVSTSIVTQSVVIQQHHPSSLPVSEIVLALEEAGFDIDSVFQDPPPENAKPVGGDVVIVDELMLVEKNRGKNTNTPSGSKQSVVTKWRPNRRYDKDEHRTKRRKTHIERCEMCRAEEKTKDAAGSLLESSISSAGTDDGKLENEAAGSEARRGELPTNEPFVAIDSALPPPAVRASLSITGMTCSSCVGSITNALREKPWIRSVEVNLLTNSACVILDSKERLGDVTGAIEELGYEAVLEQWDLLQSPEKPDQVRNGDTWRASYAIGGITCSSCVDSVTRALKDLEWVRTVDVNLMSNSAVVEFDGRDHLGKITEAIENLGYDAQLDALDDLNQRQRRISQRTVAIRVGGMYCDHCSSRVVDALKEYGGLIEIEKALTRADPILKLTYIPDAPRFTIRNILSAISAADPAFQVSLYHPPTLEERSRRMHDRQRRHILFRLGLSVIIAIPTAVIGIILMSLVPSSNVSRQYLMHPMWSGRASRAEWALFILATPVYFLAADLFHRRALKEVRALWRRGSKTPVLRRFYRFGSMDMLMSLGTTIAYFSSIAELAIDATQTPHMDSMKANPTYFDSVVFLTMFLLIGRLLEAYSKSKAGDAVVKLGKLRPNEAMLVERSGTLLVNVDLLDQGDVVRVFYGCSPPCDGVVLEGESKFDESSLTGESRLVGKAAGDEVFSGTINKGGPVTVQVSTVSGASMLDEIVKAVREGQTRRAPIERVADVLTSHFVPLVTLIAISVWVIWLSLGLSGSLPASYLDVNTGGWPFWSLQFAIAVFVIACPCGIGLAAPTALFVGGGLAAQHGILVKGGGEAFQEASGLDCIVFDKTGTLTLGGEPAITDHEFLQDDVDREMILGTVKTLEESSSHPIAKAVVAFCDARKTHEARPLTMDEVAGKGMKGSFATTTSKDLAVEVMIGNEVLMSDYGVAIHEASVATLDTWKRQGKSVALVAMRYTAKSELAVQEASARPTTWTLVASFAISDPLRPEAADTVQALRNRGMDVWMISGDNPVTAHAVGDMVGIPRSNIIAGVLPEQKADKIAYLQKTLSKSGGRSWWGGRREYSHRRATVAMVGDGVNDSPALTVADVGIAIGSGSDIAISSAEFVLISSSLTSILILIDLSRKVFRRIKFNFGWALVYNLLALPVAAGVLYPIKSTGDGVHIRLDPVWASLAMALSSLSVVCSSLLLRSRLPVVGFRRRKL